MESQQWLAFLLLSVFLPWFTPLGADPTAVSKVGGNIRWARLETASLTWDRHARSDPRLLHFIEASTSLDIDTTWHSANVEDLPEMCSYAFLFSEGLHHVTDARGLAHLQEYLNRGGFIFIDSCINTDVNPDPDVFLQMQMKTLQSILPDARMERLADDDPIFHNCFAMPDGLPHNIYNPAWAKHGLYAVHSHDHLVSLISLSGLQCGWDAMNPDPDHITNCMKMMVNIYAYAVTH